MPLNQLGFLTARKVRSAVPVSPIGEYMGPGALNGVEGNPDGMEDEVEEVQEVEIREEREESEEELQGGRSEATKVRVTIPLASPAMLS